MIRKLLLLTEDDIKYLKEIQEIYPQLNSDSAAIRFIVNDYREMKKSQEEYRTEKKSGYNIAFHRG